MISLNGGTSRCQVMESRQASWRGRLNQLKAVQDLVSQEREEGTPGVSDSPLHTCRAFRVGTA